MPIPRPSASSAARPALLAVAALTVAGAFLRFFGLGHQGFWYDEAYTAFLVHFSPGKMIGLIPSQESTPPLYYCVAWVWARIFGYGPAGLRSLSAICGVITIPLAYFAALKLLNSRVAAAIVGALACFSPLLIWYSQEARAYSMLVMFAAASVLAFAYVREQPDSRRWLVLWALSCALGLATHYYAGLVIVPEAAVLVWMYRDRRGVLVAVGSVVLVGVALLPLLLSQTTNGNQKWITATSVGKRLSQVPTLYVIGTGSPLQVVLKFVGFACVLVGLGLLAWRATGVERRRAVLPAGLFVSGFAIVLLLLVGGNDTLLGRNLLPLWLPFTIVLGAGLATVRARVVGLTATALLCVIGLIAVIGVYNNYWLQRPDWRAVATAIHPTGYPTRPPGSRLVVVQENPGVLPLGLYLPGLTYDRSGVNHGVTEIDLVAVDDHPGLGTYCWWGSACNLSPSTLQARYTIPGFHQVASLHAKQFSIRVLVADHGQTLTRAQLQRALHRVGVSRDGYLIQP